VLTLSPASSIEKPEKELKAFAKTQILAPGASEVLTFTLKPEDLASFCEECACWITEKGKYSVSIAASALDIRHKVEFEVEKEWRKKVHDVLKPNLFIE
jgi:beta-glucosidase